MRKKRLLLNTITSLLNQVIVAVCGLILPRAILSFYGSEINGLVSSITQFLGIIAFMELGVGAVAQSAMYKPLAEKDNEKLSKIMISARKFFRNIAKLFLIYVAILIFVYPHFVNDRFDPWFSGSLVLIIAINSFSEYYFGLVNQQLLNADQKSYVQLVLRSGTQILNTILCVLLISSGYSIQIVKLTTSLVFMLRPFLQWLYVKKNYDINYSIKLEEEPIKQKWNGLAQHVAAVVLDKTDVIVLTFFSSLSSVSVYSVYYLVINNLKQLIISATIGIQSLLGNLYAQEKIENLQKIFDIIEIFTHFVVTFLFCVCGCLIVPFVRVYTKGVNDINYIVPIFAILITVANALYSFRNSYNMMIKAAGHYKETQTSAIIEVIINIIVSLLLVIQYGLIGVAVGTLIAMLYRTLYFVWYLSNNILFRPIKRFAKNLIVDLLITFSSVFVFYQIDVYVDNYVEWAFLAIETSLICFVFCLLWNLIFYKSKVFTALKLLKR